MKEGTATKLSLQVHLKIQKSKNLFSIFLKNVVDFSQMMEQIKDSTGSEEFNEQWCNQSQ